MLKKIVLFSLLIAFVANLVAWVLLSGYHLFNLTATSIAIVATAALLYAVAVLPLKNAFRLSLTFLFTLIGIAIFFLLLFAKPQVQDNWCIMIPIAFFAVELGILSVVFFMRRK